MPPPRLFGLRRAPSDQSSGVLDVAVEDARSDHGAGSMRGGTPKPHTPRLISSDGLPRRESSGSGASPARGLQRRESSGSGVSPARGLMLDEVIQTLHPLLHPSRLLHVAGACSCSCTQDAASCTTSQPQRRSQKDTHRDHCILPGHLRADQMCRGSFLGTHH